MKRINFNVILNVLLAGIIGLFIFRYFYFQPKFINGEKVPEFKARLLNGEELQLSGLRGRYVLVDFWGSWCGPCRAENPKLVQLFRKYNDAQFNHAEGFEIVSIGIERNRERWLKAIKRDQLEWDYHILDLTSNMKFFDSELASLFGVRELPSKYLLNEKGVIIGVNQSADQIDRFLQEKLLN